MTDDPLSASVADTHLDRTQVAALLDRTMVERERAIAFRHLATCSECRAEIVELRAALQAVNEPRRAPRWRLAAVATAAMALLAVGVRSLRPPVGAQANAVATRAAPAAHPIDLRLQLESVSPTDDETVTLDRVRLVWRSAGRGATYLVSVQDSEGNVAWSASMTDTVANVTLSPARAADHRYYWTVDARLGDGRAVKTEVRSFSVR